MSSDEQPDALHTALARRLWLADPTVRLHHDPERESLVAEIVSAPAAVEITVDEYLVVDLDDTGDDALPTTLYLGAVRSRPDGPAVAHFREILGEQAWAVARAMVDAGDRSVRDVHLGTDDALDRLNAWRGLTDRLREPAMIGIEFTPGRLVAVLTDANAEVLDEAALDLEGNEPDDVVAGVKKLADLLASRHRGTPAETCPIGIQLGGPVDQRRGVVEFYDKPRRGRSDESWMGVPLGGLIAKRTGRETRVFNDAWAFARWELDHGAGREHDPVVVIVVRDGVGAKLLHRGEVSSFPMEIGVFLDGPGADGAPRAIQADSGVAGILDAVARITGEPVATLNDAAATADQSDEALAVFTAAGRALARGIAMIQSLLHADALVLVGPQALTNGTSAGSRGFLQAVGRADDHLGYSGLWMPLVRTRTTAGQHGAVAAASSGLAVDPCGPSTPGARQRAQG